jgi:hypothetical protein
LRHVARHGRSGWAALLNGRPLLCRAALPDTFGQLTSLRRLGLKSNRLVQLPGSFTQLASLVELFITDNLLEGFPQGMANMRSLVKLQASFNRLKQVGRPTGHTLAPPRRPLPAAAAGPGAGGGARRCRRAAPGLAARA